MKLYYILFFIILLPLYASSQSNEWIWTAISPLPLETTNNALASGSVAGEKYVYSFGGITDSLHISDIHQHVFKYTVSENTWTEMSPLPDTLGKIGSRASQINNKIYVIGGKHILADSTEISSDRVHVYNIFLDTFELDANPLPFPVHDHVQTVWRDSLIFVISGQSNGSNLSEVQVFNPYFSSWLSGTSVPNDNQFKAFGASGYILGDTIYYYGGAEDSTLPTATKKLRKGVINPDNPTDISWEVSNSQPQTTHFLGASSGHNNTMFWVGGSKDAYRFNTMKYDTNQLANPLNYLIEYNIKNNNYQYWEIPSSMMDLRSIAKLGGGNWIIAGGVDSLHLASNHAFLLHNANLTDFDKAQQPPYFQISSIGEYYIAKTENIGSILVYDLAGRVLFKSNKHLADLIIPKNRLSKGILLFVYEDNFNLPVLIKKVNP